MPFKERKRLIASTSCSTKLFTDDLREIARLSDLEKSTVSDLLRELTNEALRTRRLRAAGRDEATAAARQLYRDLLQESLQPLLAQWGDMQAQQQTQFQIWMQELLTATRALSEGSASSAPTSSGDDRWPRAQFALAAQLLRHILGAENFGRILMTVGMQRDGLSEVEVQNQLAVSDAAGARDAQQLLQQILAEYGLATPALARENQPTRAAGTGA